MTDLARPGILIAVYTRIRSLFGFLFCVIYTAVMSFFICSAGFAGRTHLATFFMRRWSLMVLRVFGIHVVSLGTENIPKRGGGILLFNHQSHFDIPALMLSTPSNIRFGAKIELYRVPFFCAAMKAVGTLPIARDNRAEVFRIYKEAEKRFEQNIIFALAPEGTRQKQPFIGRFKKGPFAFALNAQVPLIPVVIRGAYDVLPKGAIGINVGRIKRTIQVCYLPRIETKGLGIDQLENLLKRAHLEMTAVFEATCEAIEPYQSARQ